VPRGVLWIVLLTATWCRVAQANTAPALALGERHGALVPQRSTNIRVDGERLEFELEADSWDADVTAAYRMTARNAESVEIAFAFVRAMGGYPTLGPVPASVTVDGTEVEFVIKTDGEILEPRLHAWLETHPGASARFPALAEWLSMRDVGLPLRRERALEAAREVIPEAVEELQRGWSSLPEQRRLAFLLFRVDWSAGQSRTVSIRYRHQATADRTQHVNGVLRFEYLLGPARRWASFGELDVVVHLPPETDFRSELPFRREGNVRRAHFSALPPRDLTFSVMSTRGLWLGLPRHRDYWALLAFAISLPGVAIGVIIGAWRPTSPSSHRLPRALLAALLALVPGLLVSFWLGARLPDNALAYDDGIEPKPRTDFLVGIGCVAAALTALTIASIRKRRP
jgi:hypothetical protein